MAFYDDFLISTYNPKDYWKEQFQELVYQEFDNASTFQDDVEEETVFGTLQFQKIKCRINTLVDAKTGQRVNDDYKKIIFEDLGKAPEIGTRYKFSDNIWIVFSTDNIKTDTTSAYLRRCNNVINIEDKYGNIHSEPCYIDYKITETQLFKEYTMDVPQGRIFVTCQLNQYTDSIDINQRYIFNGNVYKVRERNKFDRQQTFKKNSAKTLSFYADVDDKNSADRFDIDVADYFESLYSITTQSVINGLVNTSDIIKYNVNYDNQPVSNEYVYFESSDVNICTVDYYNGSYKLLKEGTCYIYCKLFNNPNIYNTITVNVVSQINDEIVNVITPQIDYLKLNQTQTYEIYAYQNGNKLNTQFSIEAYDVPINCFTMNTTGNSFTINYNRLYDGGILKIVCTNLDNNSNTTFLINLGGIW